MNEFFICNMLNYTRIRSPSLSNRIEVSDNCKKQTNQRANTTSFYSFARSPYNDIVYIEKSEDWKWKCTSFFITFNKIHMKFAWEYCDCNCAYYMRTDDDYDGGRRNTF